MGTNEMFRSVDIELNWAPLSQPQNLIIKGTITCSPGHHVEIEHLIAEGWQNADHCKIGIKPPSDLTTVGPVSIELTLHRTEYVAR